MTFPTQGTVREPVTYSGTGIHSGRTGTVTVRPAPPNHGRVFRVGEVEIPARVDMVTRCDRATVLGKDDITVQTPEHLMAALVACGIDNAVLELEGPEVPILDGSALEFCLGLQKAGREDQKEAPRVLHLSKPVVAHGSDDSLVLALPAEMPTYEYGLHYIHPMLGFQQVSFGPDWKEFVAEIAPARTFALWEEVKPLIERGLAQGGNADNCLIVFKESFSSPLKVECEPVRHKCLDLIGDFGLLDARLMARVLAVKAGHALHVECARRVWKEETVCERA